MTQLARTLQTQDGSAVRISVLPAVNDQAVKSAKLAALYVPAAAGRPATAIVASANGLTLAQYAEQTLTAFGATEKASVHVDDLAPLPAHDAGGTVPFFVTLLATIGGYLVGVFCGMLGGPLRRRTRWAIIGSADVTLSLVLSVISGPILGAYSGHLLDVWAITCATMLAVGVVTDALGYYLGRFVIIPALFLFIFINVPASGGAYPTYFVPGIFRWLNHIVIGGYDVPLMRHTLYGVGPDVSRGILGLGAYAAVGLVLAAAGPYYAGWRRRRRAELGLSPGGMMGDASHQLMVMAAAAAAKAAGSSAHAASEEAGRELAEGEASEIEAELELASPHAGTA